MLAAQAEKPGDAGTEPAVQFRQLWSEASACKCAFVCACVCVCARAYVRVRVSVSVSVNMICSGPERPKCSTASLFWRHRLSTYNYHAHGLHTLHWQAHWHTAAIIAIVIVMQMHLLLSLFAAASDSV